ncbi:DUF269 domain-containing protein [Rhizobium sp. SEMIA 4085]|uniref:Uncharacterized protein n=1 Tax=Rhizobium gallicum bv. gallicum R602sp TaxID=1041138 RepID=A0A0B4XAS8_9HYPH|nr:hypothetical protein RGR602_PB00186 [Rhizobium gallicum bv. gallicum R602sp]NNH33563.1 DUF269 domain-containing protein [Rhizobium sp. SEMIA 4085]
MECLVRLVQEELLSDFVVTKEQRRGMAIIGDPDPDVLARLQIFYTCVALGMEERTCLQISSLMTMNHEGFGRVVLTTGRGVAQQGKTVGRYSLMAIKAHSPQNHVREQLADLRQSRRTAGPRRKGSRGTSAVCKSARRQAQEP